MLQTKAIDYLSVAFVIDGQENIKGDATPLTTRATYYNLSFCTILLYTREDYQLLVIERNKVYGTKLSKYP